MASELCGWCGQHPKGWALINDTRYCHGSSWDGHQTCYQKAQKEYLDERFREWFGFDMGG